MGLGGIGMSMGTMSIDIEDYEVSLKEAERVGGGTEVAVYADDRLSLIRSRNQTEWPVE